MRIEPADAQLRKRWAGQPVGYRIERLNGEVFQSFTRAGVVEETRPSGAYFVVVGGVVAPDTGGRIVWGIESQDIASATIDPAPSPPSNDGIVSSIDGMADRLRELADHIDSREKLAATEVELADHKEVCRAFERFLDTIAPFLEKMFNAERAHHQFMRAIDGE